MLHSSVLSRVWLRTLGLRTKKGIRSMSEQKFGRAERLECYWPGEAVVKLPLELRRGQLGCENETPKEREEDQGGAVGAEASVGEVMLPFGTQPRLRAEYANPTNTLVRMGKVLEDLDMLAGTTAWAHAFHHHMRRDKKRKQQQEHQTSAGGEGLLGEPQVGLVTASMDRIRSYHPLSIEEDLQLRAAVTWTGRSSLEVMCTVKSGPRVALHACFVMVARSLLSDTPFLVPPLLAVTAEQKAQLQAAERRAARRLQERRSSLTTVPPTAEESLHALHLMANAAGRSARKMAGTRFQHNSISHIQDSNTNKTIYGGTLVRSGFEIEIGRA